MKSPQECANVLKMLQAGMARTVRDKNAEMTKESIDATTIMILVIGDAIEHLESMEQKQTRPPLQ